jgi:glycosyltransferase involved in cell wall biosynthesis
MTAEQSLRVLRVLPTLGTGGTEKQCLEVLVELARQDGEAQKDEGRRVQVDLATLYGPPELHVLTPPPEIRVIHLNQPRSIQGLWAASRRLRQLSGDYACIHAMLWPAVWAVAWAGLRIPLVASLHGSELRYGMFNYKLALDRLAFRRAAVTVFNSQAGLAALAPQLRLPAGRTRVIQNGKGAYTGPLPERMGVVCLARVQLPKRHDLLLDALALLPADQRPLLSCIGQRTNSQEFLWQVNSRRLRSTECIGEVEQPLPYLAGAELLALPSDNEGQPNAILEAWTTRTPVLASDAPGIRELVRHGVDGWLVENTPQAWAQGLELLLGDRPLRERLAQAGKQRVDAEFSMPTVAIAWAELYLHVASRR